MIVDEEQTVVVDYSANPDANLFVVKRGEYKGFTIFLNIKAF